MSLLLGIERGALLTAAIGNVAPAMNTEIAKPWGYSPLPNEAITILDLPAVDMRLVPGIDPETQEPLLLLESEWYWGEVETTSTPYPGDENGAHVLLQCDDGANCFMVYIIKRDGRYFYQKSFSSPQSSDVSS